MTFIDNKKNNDFEMNFEEYQIEANRTCPGLGSESIDLAHMVLGMFSEYNEYLDAKEFQDKVNIDEEIADKFWYIANYCTIRKYSLDEIANSANSILELTYDKENGITEKEYIYVLSKLQDLVKKNLAYGKEIDRKVEKGLLTFVVAGISCFTYPGFNLYKSLKNNIDKLKIRFPDKFTKDNAINRDLESERKELEK